MEFAGAPGSVARLLPRSTGRHLLGKDPSGAELGVKCIDLSNEEAIRRPIAGVCPLARVVPLEVQLDAISHDRCVPWIALVILEREGETEGLEEADRGRDVTSHQHRMHSVELRHHSTLLSGRARCSHATEVLPSSCHRGSLLGRSRRIPRHIDHFLSERLLE